MDGDTEVLLVYQHPEQSWSLVVCMCVCSAVSDSLPLSMEFSGQEYWNGGGGSGGFIPCSRLPSDNCEWNWGGLGTWVSLYPLLILVNGVRIHSCKAALTHVAGHPWTCQLLVWRLKVFTLWLNRLTAGWVGLCTLYGGEVPLTINQEQKSVVPAMCLKGSLGQWL